MLFSFLDQTSTKSLVLGDLIGSYWLLLKSNQELLTWKSDRSGQRKDKSQPGSIINLKVAWKQQSLLFICYSTLLSRKLLLYYWITAVTCCKEALSHYNKKKKNCTIRSQNKKRYNNFIQLFLIWVNTLFNRVLNVCCTY